MLLIIQAVFCFFCTGCFRYGFAVEGAEQTVLRAIEVKAKKSQPKSIDVSENNPETLDLDSKENRSLTQVLQKSPAVFAQDSGTQGAPHVILRAQDPIENRYFLEGVPLTDGQFNSDQTYLLNSQSLGHIDLYADGVPAGLASDGLGGAIDFHLAEDNYNQIGMKAGSFGYLEITGKSPLGGVGRNLSLNISRSEENYTYFDNGGTPFNPGSGEFKTREHNRFFKVGMLPLIPIYRSKEVFVKYFGMNSYRDLEVPGSVSLPFNGKLNQWFHLSALSIEGWLGGRLKNKTTLFAKWDSESFVSENKNKSVTTLESNRSEDKSIGLKSQLQYYYFYPLRIEQTVAGSYEMYRLDSIEHPDKKINNSRFDLPISFSFMVPFSQVELRPALLVQSVFYEGNSTKKYLFSSPRLGLELSNLANVKGLRWESSLGRYYRAPSMQELNGTPFGLVSSTGLSPERADKLSSGFSYFLENDAQGLSAVKLSYHYSITSSKDLIAYVQNSQKSQVSTNVGKSLIQSHETSVDLKFYQLAELNTTLVLLSTENLSDLPYHYGKQIPNRPNLRIIEQIGYQGREFGLAYRVQWIGERYWDLANTKKMSATMDHGVFCNLGIRGWGQLNLELLNVFDSVTAYSNWSGFQTVDNTTGYFGYPAPGRRFYLSWNYQM